MTTPKIPLVDLKAQFAAVRKDVHLAIERVLESQNFVLGPEVEAFEREIAAYAGCQYAIGVSSGTDALLVSLMAIGVQPGDEVITSSFSFFSTAGVIARLGARPVFVDIDIDTYNIDASAVEAKVTNRTRAILPVHYAGRLADMDALEEIARRHNLWVVEDACQALGAERQGKRAGSLGHLGCFSFFPTKNLGGAGDSGMVVSNDPFMADRVALLRNHGHRPKYHNQVVGGNFRMDALQAAILRAKLPHLDEWIAARRRNAARYRRLFFEAGLLSDTPVQPEQSPVILPDEQDGDRHTFYVFQLRAKRRDALREHLAARGVGSEVYFPVPLHLQECFQELGHAAGDFPNAELLARESLALPIFPELTEPMLKAVVQAVADFYSG